MRTEESLVQDDGAARARTQPRMLPRQLALLSVHTLAYSIVLRRKVSKNSAASVSCKSHLFYCLLRCIVGAVRRSHEPPRVSLLACCSHLRVTVFRGCCGQHAAPRRGGVRRSRRAVASVSTHAGTQELKGVFEKLHKYVGKSVEQLVNRSDAPHVFRLHKKVRQPVAK